MPAYFIVNVQIPDKTKRKQYDEYIRNVKPIVESYGGKYILRSEKITALSETWKPDRVIMIQFAAKEQIFKWLSSPEYKEIASLRIASVASDAIIIEENV